MRVNRREMEEGEDLDWDDWRSGERSTRV